MKIPLDLIAPNLKQPRRDIASAEIETLAESLKKNGLMNPIAVEPADEDGIFYLLDGERRWRAAIMAGWNEIEANVREGGAVETDADRLNLALIGNLQRAEMRPVDEAMAYQELIDAGDTARLIAARVGRSFSYVRSRLAMLSYPASVREQFNSGGLPIDMNLFYMLNRLTPAEQEQVAEVTAVRNLSAARIVSMIKRMLKRANPPASIPGKKGEKRRPYGGSRVDKSMPLETSCPPLEKHPLPAEHATLEVVFRETCLECDMYRGEGVRVSCPYCAMIILARLLAKGRA